MSLIEFGAGNNIIIFGRLECINAAPLLRELKSKAPGTKFSYISVSDFEKSGGVVTCEITENLDFFNTNTTYTDLFRKFSSEILSIINSRPDQLEISFDLALVFNPFMDIDFEMQMRLLDAVKSNAGYSSPHSISVAGHTFKELEVFTFKSVHKFDDFITRMTNFKSGSNNQLLNLAKFYSRFAE